MEDTNLRELIIKLVVWLVVVLVFGSLMTIILVNKFGSKNISINKKIDKEQNLVVLVVSKNTKNTKEIKSLLKTNNIKYEIVYKDKEMYFDDFLTKLDIEKKDIIEPTLIIIEDKKAKAILVDIKKTDDLKTFLEYNM